MTHARGPLTGNMIATKADLDRVESILLDLKRQLDTLAPPQEWFGIDQAAEKLNVSASTIRRRINCGQLEARGIGKTRQVRL